MTSKIGACLFFFLICGITPSRSQEQSVARKWNEVLLEAIRNDFARPTVHARNLFHISAAMYDAWALYDEVSVPYFINRKRDNQTISIDRSLSDEQLRADQERAISYAAYYLMKNRFSKSPGWNTTEELMDELMFSLGFSSSLGFQQSNYSEPRSAYIGYEIAQKIIDATINDGSNQENDYTNLYYEPVNGAFNIDRTEQDAIIQDPNRWQPLRFGIRFTDQSGNVFGENTTPDFLSPEWGNVTPFSLTIDNMSAFYRDGHQYRVYHDPGAPCYLFENDEEASSEFKWGFGLVLRWSSHLDPNDSVIWDISPASIGNINTDQFPKDIPSLRDFYKEEGGDIGIGYSMNPITNQPYTPQMVPRGDYARVLAEFWADGPDSETPPGHWFVILNYVNDHPLHQNRFQGEEVLDQLEWDVKAYFTLGGAMHDAAISAWSIKGYYDYVRPMTILRYMADKGQSSDASLPSYHPDGLSLNPGFVEIVTDDDPLYMLDFRNEGKVKINAWQRPYFSSVTNQEITGVNWFLAENWWPYQQQTFITPPFAGYVSGHSTFSRAAAEVLTAFTGNEYFPGGLGEFEAKKDEFLEFETGPSIDFTLQWAKYYDASDQCSLSRIWGGIHPPIDDIPGRLIGKKVGKQAFKFALRFFENKNVPDLNMGNDQSLRLFPNPIFQGQQINIQLSSIEAPLEIKIVDLSGKIYQIEKMNEVISRTIPFTPKNLSQGYYFINVSSNSFSVTRPFIVR
ncbi:DUF6851 domain-containing protein [Spongiivirga sp. MCCC 1A20706]|uniref:DUF6851 domain-containing protein n=1 Tax=Spongiivirga sp. MCCC 1A20706 TaxID=3160963 RepID=UPI00397740B4